MDEKISYSSPGSSGGMPVVLLPGTGLQVSRFIFGTASLFNAGRKQERNRLLHAAVEAGFTHFDTAPYYGFGAAERDLASVLRDYPSITVTSKVGIYSPGGEKQPDGLVFARKAAGRLVPYFSRPTIDFSLKRAQVALEGSLRRMGREHINLYLLHEPSIELITSDEWLRWLEDMMSAGKVGSFGLALEAHLLEPFLKYAPDLCGFVQVLDSLYRREADLLLQYGKSLQVTYGYVSAALAAGDGRPTTEVLREALRRNPHGAIIVSTRKLSRLSQYAALLNQEGQLDD